jgi:transposase-like protein
MARDSMDVSGDLIQGLFSDPQKMREVLEVICQVAMAQEVSAHVGAESHERSTGRCGLRNGYKPRTLATRVGALSLSVPQVRDCEGGPYHPSLFARWERSERALLVACGFL